MLTETENKVVLDSYDYEDWMEIMMILSDFDRQGVLFQKVLKAKKESKNPDFTDFTGCNCPSCADAFKRQYDVDKNSLSHSTYALYLLRKNAQILSREHRDGIISNLNNEMSRYEDMGITEEGSKESEEYNDHTYTKREYIVTKQFIEFIKSYPLNKDVFLLI